RRKYKEACDKNSDLHDLWATKAKNTAIRSRKELSRNGEHLMLSMLLKNLGCVETINCKSGCDRTSIVHMMSTALSQMLQEAKDDSEKCEAITKMACNFDKLTVELDKHIATAEEWKAYVESLTEATDHKSEQLLLAAELRNVIAKHSEAAQLVAFFSTGRRGLKYGGVHVQKGFGKIKTNPHVAKMFPPYITLADGNTLKIKDGHDKFTEEGSRWIQDSSQQRGG
ncbi:MAG: hypothetical protein HN685_06105, partial [Waddliaceae bacterium]|nr:hypothetical protein [Waddliaceae bacterium]